MKKMIHGILIVLFLAGLPHVASARSAGEVSIEDLWVQASSTGLYLAAQTLQDGEPVLRIGHLRKTAPIRWEQMVGRATSVATLQNDLYIAFDDGTLIRGTGPIFLRKLPDGLIPGQWVPDGNRNRLFLSARQSVDQPEESETSGAMPSGMSWSIYELVGGQWQVVVDLPDELNITGVPKLIADNGRIELFAIAGSTDAPELQYWIFSDNLWVHETTIPLNPTFRNYQPVRLEGRSVIVVSEADEIGNERLYLYSPDHQPRIGPLEVNGEPLVLKTPYGIVGEIDRIVAGYLSDESLHLLLARWSNQGEFLAPVEVTDPLYATKKQDHSFVFTLLLVTMIMTVFLTRGRVATLSQSDLPSDLVVSTFWRRGAAFVIDFFGITLLSFILVSLFWSELSNVWTEQGAMGRYLEGGQVDPRMYLIAFITTGSYVGYCIVMEGVYGWTLGKKILGLEVRQVRDTRQRCSWMQIVLRNVFKVLELHLWPLLFMVLLTMNRQRIGDLIAGTVVLQKKNGDDTKPSGARRL